MSVIKGLDTDLLGESIADAVERYGAMQEAVTKADRAHAQAQERVGHARREDVQALAEAQLEGKTAKADAERRANDALADAKRTALAARRAEELARDALLDDVREHKADYEQAISDEVEQVQRAALAALAEYETHARRLAELRAHRVWLQRPVKGEGRVTGPRVVVDEVGPVGPVVAGARQVVTGDRPKSTQSDWGIPAGIVPDDGMAYKLRRPFDPKTGTGGPEDGDAQASGASVQSRLMDELASDK